MTTMDELIAQVQENAPGAPCVFPDPKPKEIWVHKSGRLYRVLMLTNDPNTEDFPRTVVYETLGVSQLWSRPLSRWHASFRPHMGVVVT